MATSVTRFSETFEGWGFEALSIGATVKKYWISYHTVTRNFQFSPTVFCSVEHYAGLPRRARCGAVEAPDGLMLMPRAWQK